MKILVFAFIATIPKLFLNVLAVVILTLLITMYQIHIIHKIIGAVMETEMIMIGAMASFILGLQFYGIKQLNKLCERVTALEVKVSNIHP